jgi:hypothetical protein
MGWVVRRLFVVYAFFGALAFAVRWARVPAPWLDGMMAVGAGLTLIAMGWRAHAPVETAPRREGTVMDPATPERAVP